MDPHDRARIVCQRISRRISEVAPTGLGRWNDAWEYVAGPSDAFLDALGAWTDGDDPVTRSELLAAAEALIQAWRQASRAWKDAGRPVGEEEPPSNDERIFAKTIF